MRVCRLGVIVCCSAAAMHEKLNDSARAAVAAQLHMTASQEQQHHQQHHQHFQHNKQLPMLSSHAGSHWLPASPPRPHPPLHPSHPSEDRDAASHGQRLDGDEGGAAANPLARRQQREIFDLGVRAGLLVRLRLPAAAAGTLSAAACFV